MERTGFRPTGISRGFEAPKLGRELFGRRNFTPLSEAINRPPWSAEKSAAFEEGRSRYLARMNNEAINYVRKKHKKRDSLALTLVRASIAKMM